MSMSASINIGGHITSHIRCNTYEKSVPILVIDVPGAYLSISGGRHQDSSVTEADVEAARALLTAAQTFLDDLVAKHTAQQAAAA